MCTRVRQAGLSLIELVIFIVIVSVGVAGVLSVMNVTTQHSADPMVRKQVVAFAESLLEEVMAKNYCDPDFVACTISVEATRDLYDDIADYDGKTFQGTDTLVGAGVVPALAGYSGKVDVAAEASVNAVPMRRITVTVTGGTESLQLSGYRANY